MKAMDPKSFNKMVFDWTDKLTSYGANWQFIKGKGNSFSQFRLTKFIEEDGFSNDLFYKTFERMEVVGNQMIRVLQLSLGDVGPDFKSDTNSPPFIG